VTADEHFLRPIRALATVFVVSVVLASCSNGPDYAVPPYGKAQPIPRCSVPDARSASSLAMHTVRIPGSGPLTLHIPGRVLALSPHSQTIWAEPVGTACLIRTTTSTDGGVNRRDSLFLIQSPKVISLDTLVDGNDYAVSLNPVNS
jgi:hypothetical protein